MTDAKAAAAGVDRGGTWTRLAWVDSKGRKMRGVRFPTSELGRLPALLENRFKKYGLAAGTPLIIATRGAFTQKWKRKLLFRAAKGRLNLLNVISDAEAAHTAAFGGKEGLLLIAGTGAVAFYGSGHTRPVKTGGHNPAGGDPGSGRWLGKRCLKKLNKPAADLGPRRIAAYARKLISAAEKEAGWQRRLVSRAQNSLALLLMRSLKKLGRRTGTLKVALAGGLVKNDFFRKGLIARTRELSGIKLVFSPLNIAAETAAARLALAARKRGERR